MKKKKPFEFELPKEAYAIVGDPDDPTTWQLPHHTRSILVTGRVQSSVNWAVMDEAAASLSLQGYKGKRVVATPQQILDAARHLASHYTAKGLPIPRGLWPML